MEIEVSFICNREAVQIPKSQVYFIGAIVLPLFLILEENFPSISPMVDNIHENKEKWEIIS